MKKDLLLEIGAEELPAKEVAMAAAAMRDGIVSRLAAQRLTHGEAQIFFTPRRLVLHLPGLEAAQADREEEKAGPPLSAAYKDGKPTKAAEGFARGLGLEVSALFERDTPKGKYLFAKIQERGQATAALLPAMVTETLAAIPFQRSMRWGDGDATFARPVQWIVALFGDEVVPLQYGDVRSGKLSRGHRFLAPEYFEVRSFEQYLGEIGRRHVLLDPVARKKAIREGAEALAKKVSGTIRPDETLLDEITQLVEKPVPMLGDFDPKFLEIPDQVLISEMREHQRYLSVVGADGRLLPHFVVIGNTEVRDVSVAMNGYRRVLSARFADGAFFFSEDKKTPLLTHAEKLSSMLYHRQLGTIREKVDRVARLAFSLAGSLSDQLGSGVPRDMSAPSDLYAFQARPAPSEPGELWKWKLARAAYLMKADLSTRMVFEFPELQGVMGQAYALAAGEPPEVAAAIAEHYMPRNAGDELPEGSLGALLGLADRLDTIAGIFAVGKGPTGSADPFGLRRAAIGFLNLLNAKGWRLSIDAAIADAIDLVGAKSSKPPAVLSAEVKDFLVARWKNQIVAATSGVSISPDVAEAVLGAGFSDPLEVTARAEALAQARSAPDFELLFQVCKRVNNILKGQTPAPLVPGDLVEPVEQALWSAIQNVTREVEQQTAARDFEAAFRATQQLDRPVAHFFEAVMVLSDDPKQRAARLALLDGVRRVFAGLADLAKLS